MNFSYQKAISLAPKKEKKLSTFLMALLMASIIFLPFMFVSKGYFVFFGDFNVQQIPFYKMCHRMIKSGNISWNFFTDLGANFIGSYSFYLLGSPFFWLTIPFPNNFVPYLMGPLLILKFACAAFTAYLYIRRFTRTPEAARLGALLYAFSGFSVYNIFFNHFHEPLICFPLLLLALEMLITENKRGVFALAVMLSAFVNYFFFFGMVVFTVIYFFVRLFSGSISVKISRFFVLLFEAVLGVLMSAILLLPSLYAIIGNARVSEFLLGWRALVYGKGQIYLNILQCFFFPPDLPARPVFFPDANIKWSSIAGWLPLFGATGILTVFITKKKSWIKRILAVSLFMALIPVLNSAFYAFNAAYYARWFYMPLLIAALSTAMLSEDKEADWTPGYKWSLVITLAFSLVIGLFPRDDNGKLVFGLFTKSNDNMYLLRFWLTCIIAVCSLIVLGLLLKVRKQNINWFVNSATVCVAVISVLYSIVFIAFGRSHSYDIKETVIPNLIEGEVYLEDESEFRIDTYDGIDNTGMYLGLPSINAFHSVVPSSIVDYYDFLGITRDVASRPDTDYPAIRSLLSVKYLLNRTDGTSFTNDNGDTKMPGYTYLKASGGYYVFKNDNYVPYGFSYDYYMTKGYAEKFSGKNRSRMMLKAVILTKEQIKKYGDSLTDIKELGKNGEKAKISLSLTDKAMAKDTKTLAKSSAVLFKTTKTGFKATVKRDKRSLVFFSVPYDKGFTATVNGKKAEIEKVNIGFMAVCVPSGKSTIEFTYKTPGLFYGTVISTASLFVFLVYILASLLFIRRKGKPTDYPEGDILIQKWQKEDISETVNNFSGEKNYDDTETGIPDIDDIESLRVEIEKEDEFISTGFIIDTEAFNNDDA